MLPRNRALAASLWYSVARSSDNLDGAIVKASMLRTTLLTAALVAMVASAATAQAFRVTLVNGTTFETRYQPRPAPWDDEKVIFMSELGNLVSLEESEIASVDAISDLRGFGRVIDTTTIDLGIMPNDLTDEQIEQRRALPEALPQRFDMEQFVEPDEVGGGMPVWRVGGGGGPAQDIPGAPIIPPIPGQQPLPAPVPPVD
jgi:hypothetical protein